MRIRKGILSLALFAHFFFAAVAFGADSGSGGNYAAVPGITEDDIAAIKALAHARPEGFVYGMLLSDEAFFDENDEPAGFSRLVCRHLSELFGTPFSLRIMGWDDLLSGLASGEIDFTGELAATPERARIYHMTTSIAERSLVVFRSANRDDIDIIAARDLLKYGFLRGGATFDRVLKTSEVPFEATILRDYVEAAQAIRDGTIDAFISEGMMESAFGDDSGITHQKYYPLTYTSVCVSTANPELAPIIDVLQKYLDGGGLAHFMEMYEEGIRAYARQKLFKRLDDDEIRFIREMTEAGKPVPLAAEFDNYPISFYNRREKAWQGIARDILTEVEALTGLTFEAVNAPDEAWNSLMARLESGDAWIVTELVKSKNRRGRFLWPGEPYARDIYALLSRADVEDISPNRVIGAKVGLIRGTAYEEAFRRVFPGHMNVVVYGDNISAFDALEAKEVDLVMLPRNRLLSATHYMERPSFKVNVPIEVPCDSFFGFNRDQDILCGIVDKAQSVVDCWEVEDRWKRRVFDYNRKLSEARLPYIVGISLLVIAIMALVVALYRKRAQMSWLMGMTDALTKIPNRRFYDEQILRDWEDAIRQRLNIALLTIDIDHFKRYNDTYGHPQGDVLLRSMAEIFKCALSRASDTVARTGGEEFSVILPNTDEAGAVHVAEKIREDVEGTVVLNAQDGAPTSVTVSVGVAVVRPRPGDDMEAFVASSDKALYEAKASGRNRVCVARGDGVYCGRSDEG